MMGRIWHVALMRETGQTSNILATNAEEKRPLGKPII
jgi:hypothetical protein